MEGGNDMLAIDNLCFVAIVAVMASGRAVSKKERSDCSSDHKGLAPPPSPSFSAIILLWAEKDEKNLLLSASYSISPTRQGKQKSRPK